MLHLMREQGFLHQRSTQISDYSLSQEGVQHLPRHGSADAQLWLAKSGALPAEADLEGTFQESTRGIQGFRF